MELCLLGLWRLVFHLVPCSSSGACDFEQLPLPQVALQGFCLFWHRMPGLLLHWWRRMGCNPSFVFSVLLLRRLACRGSLGSAPCVRALPWGLWLLFGWQCGGALWLPIPLGLCYLFCHLLLRFSASVGAVLCSLLGFPCLRVGTLLAWGVYGVSLLRSLQSRLPFVVGPPFQVCWSSPALAVGWFGHGSVAPPAAPVCWALVGSLLRRYVALGSCAPYPVGSSLEDSYGFVVQAPGVFLDSLLGFFPLASSCYGWLGVVVACTSCRVPYLWLTLCSSACVSPGGCPSFSGWPCAFALGSSSLDLVCVGFNSFLLLCIPSGCGHPLGQ